MHPREVLTKSAKRAATATGAQVSGAVALAASAATWNPLPIIGWAVGYGIWVCLAATSERYQRYILDEERASMTADLSAAREAIEREIHAVFLASPFHEWAFGGAIPHYPQRYMDLVELRNRVARIAHDRQEVDLNAEQGMIEQLERLLTAYLELVRARIAYLQILSGIRIAVVRRPASLGATGIRGVAERAIDYLVEREPVVDAESEPYPRSGRSRATLPTAEDRIADLQRQIADLQRRAEREPATARVRASHIGVLEQRVQVLKDCAERDARAAAQLEMFADVFQAILDRVSAARYNAGEVAETMGSFVKEVEETQKLVEAVQPSMDEFLGGMPIADLMHQ